jgi:predicted acyltransferase
VGIDLVMLPALIYLIEIEKRKKWTSFFLVFGKNPLFIYLLSELLLIVLYAIPMGERSLQETFYRGVLLSFASPINASLLFAIIFMLMCWAIGYVLDRKKIYIRV